ncbi:hypothetical protein [uncultured Salinibacterium sp.]|uniref:hypothetical protein n=1 Tax=uncultured Salinibacterium sp. TaxID=459274 RepID=UPI0030D93848|tara:strand:- start:78247 stop:79599 length:1353 start_codon:yes stop_codon:yes gene_type:complete
MLKLLMRRAEIPAEREAAFVSLISALSDRWKPLVRPLRESQAGILGASSSPLNWGAEHTEDLFSSRRTELIDGEVFVFDSALVVMTVARNTRGARVKFVPTSDGGLERVLDESAELILRVSVVSVSEENATEYLDEIGALCLEHFEIAPVDFHYKNSSFDALRSEALIEEVPSEEKYVAASLVLSDAHARSTAIAIKSSRGLLKADALKRVPVDPEQAPNVLDALHTAGIISTEMVVVCGTSGNQVARLDDDAANLDALSNLGLRCACGKPINEEVAQELYSVSPMGIVLLNKSRWMSVLVRDRLQALGVPNHYILLECQLGSDEIDCIALISGELTIFELKDKEFSIGNAYSFGAKMGITSPSHAVIVTTDSVSEDVKSHFSRTQAGEERRVSSNSHQIHYVEGGEFLKQLDTFVSSVFEKDAQVILDDVLKLATARASSVVGALKARA